MRRILALGLAAALAAAVGAGAVAGHREDAAQRGARYIAERQQPTGTFFSPETPADAAAEAVVALVAGGLDGEPVDRALGYIRDEGPDLARENAGWAGRIAMGIAAGDRDPRDFGGADYAELIGEHYDPATGRYHANVYTNALALLGLAAAGVDPPADAIRYVRANQCADGGFAWASGCAGTPDVDTTSHTLNAMLALGIDRGDLTVSRARDWLVRARNDQGAFGHKPGEPTSGNSTGLALSAIAALGEDPTGEPWADEAGDPLGALLALQTGSGGFKNLADDEGPNDYATVQAVPGAAGRTYPLLPETEGATPTPDDEDEGSRPEDEEPTPTNSGASSDRTPAPEDRPDESRPAHPNTPALRSADGADGANGADDPTLRPVGTPPTPGTPTGDTFGSGEHRAGLLVRGEDGELRRMCVLFDEPETDGLALLEAAGLDLGVERFGGQGTAICRIGPDGCSGGGDCFCEYPTFWGYWVRDPGDEGWRLSELGAERRTVSDGSTDAWVWGPDGGDAPPDIGVEDVCPAAADRGTTSTATPRTTEDGPVNVPAMAGIGTLLLGSGVALGVRRWRAG